MPMAEQMKSAVGFFAPGQNRNAIAIGMIKRSQVSDGFNFTINTVGIADTNSDWERHLQVLFNVT
jgi:hypothetical protein